MVFKLTMFENKHGIPFNNYYDWDRPMELDVPRRKEKKTCLNEKALSLFLIERYFKTSLIEIIRLGSNFILSFKHHKPILSF